MCRAGRRIGETRLDFRTVRRRRAARSSNARVACTTRLQRPPRRSSRRLSSGPRAKRGRRACPLVADLPGHRGAHMVCAEKASAAESTRPNFEVAGASQKARPCKPQSSRATAGDRAAPSGQSQPRDLDRLGYLRKDGCRSRQTPGRRTSCSPPPGKTLIGGAHRSEMN